MNLPLTLLTALLSRANRSRVVAVGSVIALGFTIVAVAGIARELDAASLGGTVDRAAGDPAGLALALGAFGAAFMVRAIVWSRLVPALGVWHSLAGIHMALGANHVLPFRLGEPLRVVSVVRRAGINAGDAAATGGLARLGDVLGLLAIGLVLGPGIVGSILGGVGTVIATVLALAFAVVLVAVLRRARVADSIAVPDLFTVLGTLGAWLLEAVLVWRSASWVGVELSYRDAVLVASIAVAAQLLAIAPGGIGTYEAAASLALVAISDISVAAALEVAVVAHLLKTIYSLIAGVIAVFAPSPSMFGSLRLPKERDSPTIEPIGDGPIAFFLPAFQEGPRIASVIERIPETAAGRAVEVLVIDDGSTDETVSIARQAGATVVSLPTNRGLGAAVAAGFAESLERFDAAIAVFCDADGEYDPAELESIVEPILAGDADYVIGSRFAGEIEHMRPHRRIGNLTLTRWVRWMSRVEVTDGQSGYRALSAQAAAAVDMAHDYNYAQVLTLDLLRQGFRYAEVPITYRFRESGDSFVKLGRYLRAVVPAVWAVLNRPSQPSVETVAPLR